MGLYAQPRIAYILPTGGSTAGHLTYARGCLESLLRNTQPAHLDVIVVDDASPDWTDAWCTRQLPGTGRVHVHRFNQPGGLTRSWNAGFRIASGLDPDYIAAGNDDVLVPGQWWRGLVGGLQANCDIVGPLTNAPGSTEGGEQDIRRWLPEYTLSDKPEDIDAVNDAVRRKYGGARAGPINGFLMFARAQTWWRYRHDDQNVFPPLIVRLPSGRRNRTPRMTGQEDWLNVRVRRAGRLTGAALGSFVFHYRSVSRGLAFARRGGQWHRRPPEGGAAPC